VVATLLPLSRCEAWWVRGLDFPRLQLAVLALALLLAGLWLAPGRGIPGWLALLACAACLAYQAWWVAPYTRWHRREVQAAGAVGPGRCLTILNSNVLTSNRNADALLALVRRERPDILVTLESDTWWQARLDTLANDYPHALKCPLDNLYGMHVYSRLPLEEGSIEYLVEEDVPSMHALVRLPCGRGVRVHFLHPAPPSPTENEASGERDAELVMVARSVQQASCPVVVTGDLNDVAWSETTRLFRKISGLLDPRVGRGMFNTFHADHAWLRWPLDHLFHSEHFTLVRIARLPHIGSDHFPLLATLALEPAQAEVQEGISPDAEDRALAREKLARQQVTDASVPTPGAQGSPAG
jgi:endonuclease/exonuclease/phosphatase (EEP) superfamily protein YafD